MRDADGFDEFYRVTRHRLLAFLYAAGGDLAEAQDAAQEAYTRAWQRWADLGRHGDPEAWVRTVGGQGPPVARTPVAIGATWGEDDGGRTCLSWTS